MDLALESNFNQLFMQFDMATVPKSEAEALATLRHPRTVMTFSDSGAHVSLIMDSSIHTHLLAYWVRERKAFSLEEGVKMITLVPAMALNVDMGCQCEAPITWSRSPTLLVYPTFTGLPSPNWSRYTTGACFAAFRSSIAASENGDGGAGFGGPSGALIH